MGAALRLAGIALAAVAAAETLFASMIPAAVFGAVDANLGRRLPADRAGEGHYVGSHFFSVVVVLLAALGAAFGTG